MRVAALTCAATRGDNECGKNRRLNSVTRRDAVAGFGEAPRGDKRSKSFCRANEVPLKTCWQKL